MNNCEIILYLDHCFRRSPLKEYLSRALAALMFTGTEPFAIFVGHSCEIF